MRKVKLVAIGVVAILTVIILFQNTDSVQARILFWGGRIPLALLMLLIFFLGFVIGLLVPTYFRRKRGSKSKPGPGQGR